MSNSDTDHATTILRSGTLKGLGGPIALHQVIDRAKLDFEVTVTPTALEWTRPGAGVARLIAADIEQVRRHGSAFVVTARENAGAVRSLTFGTSSHEDAEAWITALGDLVSDESDPASASAQIPGEAQPGDVRLEFADGSAKDYATLVVACDPRGLIDMGIFDADQLTALGRLENYYFHTTLLEVCVDPELWLDHGVILAPSVVDAMAGGICAFRNETAKTFKVPAASKLKHNLVTVYQIARSHGDDDVWSEERFARILDEQLPTLDWWPFGSDYRRVHQVFTPYFDHYNADALRDGEPWKLLESQGRRRILITHASTCFESALHCWYYAQMMLDRPEAAAALPRDKDAPIAILGAGVSGTLFAGRLRSMGYRNIDLLEKAQRVDGKTHTITIVDGPCPPDKPGPTVCELGTCYLSPDYDEFVHHLRHFPTGDARSHGVPTGECDLMADNDRFDVTRGNAKFRGIVTEGELPAAYGAKTVESFDKYIVLKALAETGRAYTDLAYYEAELELALAIASYGILHPTFVGRRRPMPAEKPALLDKAFGHQTYYEFLKAHRLESMLGALQYAYEVQGYGPVKEIPAFYGLLWITPPITWSVLADSLPSLLDRLLGLRPEKTVTALSRGWGDIWSELRRALDLHPTCNVSVTSITTR